MKFVDSQRGFNDTHALVDTITDFNDFPTLDVGSVTLDNNVSWEVVLKGK